MFVQYSGSKLEALLNQGVKIPHPGTVFIANDVVPEQIMAGTTLHPGCRISGAETIIGPDCELGEEGPVVIANCQLGRQVKLAGGFFSETTFWDHSSMGSSAHVRPGTLLEEHAGGAHCVGLKQTILFPYARLGSLINFCDALLSGGTHRHHHSEVGSGYVHFNFTPHHDKATASLVGDVPRGVMLNQAPIFLGGQGGLVGPARIEFGAIVRAGDVASGDITQPGLFCGKQSTQQRNSDFQAGLYHAINRIVLNNLRYIGNIYALRAWYRHVRSIFQSRLPHHKACLQGAEKRFKLILEERVMRLRELAENMPESLKLAQASGHDTNCQPYTQQAAFIQHWPRVHEELLCMEQVEGDCRQRDVCLQQLARASADTTYIQAVKNLDNQGRATGTTWLNSIVEPAIKLWTPVL